MNDKAKTLLEELEELGVQLDEISGADEDDAGSITEKVIYRKRRRGAKKTPAKKRRAARQYYKKHKAEIKKKARIRRKKEKQKGIVRKYRPGQAPKSMRSDLDMISNLSSVLDRVALAIIPGVWEEAICDAAERLHDILEYLGDEVFEDERIPKLVEGLEKVTATLTEDEYDDDDVDSAVEILRMSALYLADLIEELEEDEETEGEDEEIDELDFDEDEDEVEDEDEDEDEDETETEDEDEDEDEED